QRPGLVNPKVWPARPSRSFAEAHRYRDRFASVNAAKGDLLTGGTTPPASLNLGFVEYSVDGASHIVDGAHAVHFHQAALLFVVGQQRRGLLVVGAQPHLEALGIVVRPAA